MAGEPTDLSMFFSFLFFIFSADGLSGNDPFPYDFLIHFGYGIDFHSSEISLIVAGQGSVAKLWHQFSYGIVVCMDYVYRWVGWDWGLVDYVYMYFSHPPDKMDKTKKDQQKF